MATADLRQSWAFGRRLGTASQFQSVAVRAHPREQPHWYLAVIGVDPARQGSWVGAGQPHHRARRPDAGEPG